MRTFADLKVTGTICHVKKTEQQGAFHLKSSAVNVAQAGLKYHIFVTVFLCVEEDHVTHSCTKSTKHGGNMSLWWSCDEAAAWQAVLAESQAPQRRGTACLQDFFFFFYWREQTKYSSSIENWP